ncbi:molybdopterin-dependent oxidoreductase [Jejubacter calystegiae]|uniref:molybdopterin-dependent oxidoreductase n=1 Tax=Jejubacter calystegiae TaxID=2579935 RepID=UPI003BAD24E1
MLACYGDYNLKQLSLGTHNGIYDSTIPLLETINNRSMLVWAVDGELLSLEEGYPLRFVDFSLYRYKGVKCLSKLHIVKSFEQGFWEKKAKEIQDSRGCRAWCL